MDALICYIVDQQCVKIGRAFSSWTSPNSGMPQETGLGPYVFLIIINYLKTNLPIFEFVDDVTITEVIDQAGSSQMQVTADQVSERSRLNFLNISAKRTKEMLFGSILKKPPQITLDAGCIERVTTFKLLGTIVTNNLNWNKHVSAICVKAGRRLHLLRLLKRSSVPYADLLQYYKSVIRPTIEYYRLTQQPYSRASKPT
jgi:hypothetical protein